MNIWLIDPHDAVPGESWGYKHGMFLCQTLAARGHQVTYWTVNFAHATKTFRAPGWYESRPEPNIRILMVPIRPYYRHVSVSRLLALLDYARGLWTRGKRESRPDCIIATLPAPFADVAAVRLKKWHNTRLVCDLRDLWPELFLTVFPRALRPFAHLFMLPLYWARRYAFQNSDAVTSVCSSYLEYMKQFAPQVRTVPQRIIYSTGVELGKFTSWMNSQQCDDELPAKQTNEIWATYAGTLGSAYDVQALLEAARILRHDATATHVRIMVAGDGPLRIELEKAVQAHDLQNLTYLGVLSMPKLCRLYALSDIGLSIYAPGSTVAIPAKAFDYYAAGLPVVNSVTGEYATMIEKEKIGLQYEAGSGRSLAAAIVTLAARSADRAEMKQRLQARAPHYDRDRQYSQIYDLLEEHAATEAVPAAANS